MLEWTGDRYIPTTKPEEVGAEIHYEHLHRYYFASQLVKNKIVLDLGCGEGYGSYILSKYAKKVVGVDIDDKSIKHASSTYIRGNLEYIVGSATSIPIEGEEIFDAVICFEVLEHIAEQEEMLKEVKRVLKRDGIFVVSTPNKKVYSDEPNYQNPFHVKELYFDDFKALLGKYFKHLYFFGQRVYPSSQIWYLAEGNEKSSEFVIERGERSFVEVETEKKEPMYFIAIASDSPLEKIEYRSYLTDISDVLINNFRKHIQHLERKLRELGEELNRLNSIAEQKEQQIRELGAKIVELENALSSKREELGNLKVLAKEKEVEVDRLTRLLEQKDVEIKNLHENLRRLQNEISSKEDHIFKITRSLEEKIKELNDFKVRTVNLEQKLKNLENELKEKEGLLEKLSWELEAKEGTVAELQQENQKVKSELAAKDEQIRTLTEENIKLSQELESIKSSLTWRSVMRWHSFVERVAPLGTRRRRWYDLGIKGLRIWVNDGFSKFLISVKNYIKNKEHIGSSGQLYYNISNIEQAAIKPFLDDYIRYITPRKFRVLYIHSPWGGLSLEYRVFNFEEYLKKVGVHADHFIALEIPNRIEEIPKYDLVVLFRVAYDENVQQVIEICHKLSIPTIFDIDDYVFEPSIANEKFVDGVRFLSDHEKKLYVDGVMRFRKTLMLCDFVTTSTDFLAERAKELGKRAFVLRNGCGDEFIRICEDARKNKKKDEIVRIGYFSGTKTHQKDFSICVKPLAKILREFPHVRLLIVGELDISEFPELKDLQHKIEYHPFVPHHELPYLIASVDINIVPLEYGNPYCEGKSELKYFEAGLVEVPTIASPTNSYIYAIKNGLNGFLAKDENEWYNKLKMLIEDKNLREKIGKNAREHVLKNYTSQNLGADVFKTYQEIILQKLGGLGFQKDSLSIGIIVPEPFAGSGGHTRIFEIAQSLAEMGHRVKIYITGEKFTNSSELESYIGKHFIKNIKFKTVRGVDKITSCDALFATHWSTVYPLKENRDKAFRTFYFVQDYEPLFHPMSEEYIFADLSYQIPDTLICYGRWNYEILKNKISSSQKIYWLNFYINKAIFKKLNLERKDNVVLFFARPEMPRRLYNLGIKALQIVKTRMPDVEIVFYGSSKIDSSSIPFDHVNLGLLPTQEDLAKLYNQATVGVVFNTTNPSMTPFEMMACGLPVVDIDYNNNYINYGDRNNAMLVEPFPESIADGIIKLLKNKNLREELAENGYSYVGNFPNYEQFINDFENILLREVSNDE